MIQTFVIKGTFVSLNKWTAQARNPKARARIKREHDKRVVEAVREYGIGPMNGPIRYHVLWVEPNRKRDLDNIAFGKKFVQDGLVKAGIIPNDTSKEIAGFSDSFAYDRKNPRIEITLEEI